MFIVTHLLISFSLSLTPSLPPNISLVPYRVNISCGIPKSLIFPSGRCCVFFFPISDGILKSIVLMAFDLMESPPCFICTGRYTYLSIVDTIGTSWSVRCPYFLARGVWVPLYIHVYIGWQTI